MKTSEVFTRFKDLSVGASVKIDDLYTQNNKGQYFKIIEVTKYDLGQGARLQYTIQLPNGKTFRNVLAKHMKKSYIKSIQEIRKESLNKYLS